MTLDEMIEHVSNPVWVRMLGASLVGTLFGGFVAWRDYRELKRIRKIKKDLGDDAEGLSDSLKALYGDDFFEAVPGTTKLNKVVGPTASLAGGFVYGLPTAESELEFLGDGAWSVMSYLLAYKAVHAYLTKRLEETEC